MKKGQIEIVLIVLLIIASLIIIFLPIYKTVPLDVFQDCNTNNTYIRNSYDSYFLTDNYDISIVQDCWVKCKAQNGKFKLSCENNKPICKCRNSILQIIEG